MKLTINFGKDSTLAELRGLVKNVQKMRDSCKITFHRPIIFLAYCAGHRNKNGNGHYIGNICILHWVTSVFQLLTHFNTVTTSTVIKNISARRGFKIPISCWLPSLSSTFQPPSYLSNGNVVTYCLCLHDFPYLKTLLTPVHSCIRYRRVAGAYILLMKI